MTLSQNQDIMDVKMKARQREDTARVRTPSQQVKEGGVIVFPCLSRYTNSIKGALEAPAKISLVAQARVENCVAREGANERLKGDSKKKRDSAQETKYGAK